MINTSAPAATAPPAEENKDEGAGGENYEQGALDDLTLALQIISDFREGDESGQRKKLVSFLEIDTLLSRVQLFNHAPDYQSALEDLKCVEALCTEFPEKNESTMTSAIFQMGRCTMELSLHE